MRTSVDRIRNKLGRVIAADEWPTGAQPAPTTPAPVPGPAQSPWDHIEFQPGHFYSPHPDLDDLRQRSATVFDRTRYPAAIDIREREQLDLLERLAAFQPDLPWADEPTPGLRYNYVNNMYAWGDAAILFGMLRHFEPKRIIEVGSGFSSAAMLDTLQLAGSLDDVELTFIEPYTERLRGLLGENAPAAATVVESPVQAVPVERFATLEQGDFLFIDSTHVARPGGDLNYLLFEVLPTLAPGVLVHFHDLFWPFEYPESWVFRGRAWNECYLLRAFLQYNEAWEVVLFANYLATMHAERSHELIPMMKRNSGGGLWIRPR